MKPLFQTVLFGSACVLLAISAQADEGGAVFGEVHPSFQGTKACEGLTLKNYLSKNPRFRSGGNPNLQNMMRISCRQSYDAYAQYLRVAKQANNAFQRHRKAAESAGGRIPNGVVWARSNYPTLQQALNNVQGSAATAHSLCLQIFGRACGSEGRWEGPVDVDGVIVAVVRK